MPRLAELDKAYTDRGVVFLAINSNAHETAEQVAAHAREHGIDFPVLKDPGNLVADLALVERTCEVLVLDGRARIRYRGAIDDQYSLGAARTSAAQHYLARRSTRSWPARRSTTPATAVAGCLIDRAEPGPRSARRRTARRGSGRRPPRSWPPWKRRRPRSRSRSAR